MRPTGRVARALAAVGGLTAALALAVAPAAALEDGSTPLEVRAVDARGGALVVDVFTDGEDDLSDAQVAVDGRAVTTSAKPLLEAGLPSSAVVVIDNSASLSNGTVQLAKEAVAGLAPSEGALRTVGVISTGGGARVLARPGTAPDVVARAVEGLSPSGGSRLYDALVEAAALLERTGETQRNVVLVVGSADVGGGATFTRAVTALRNAGASVHLVSVAGAGVPVDVVRDLATRTGGSLLGATDDELDAAVGAVLRRIEGQVRLTSSAAPAVAGELAALTVESGGRTARVSYRPGVLSVGSAALAYVPTSGEDAGFFASSLAKWLTIATGAAAVAGLVYAVAQLALRRNEGLDFALRHYDETYGVVGDGEVDGQSLATSAILKRAVAVTGDLAEKRGLLSRIEHLLERADLPLRPAEALFFYVAFAAVSVLVAFVVSGNLLASLAVALVALVLPSFAVDFLAKRRKKKFVALLPDMLQLLSGTLRAGYSIGQGFEAVSTEVEEPMGKELRRAVTEARLGRPLDEALEAVAKRVESEDFEWAVMAIRIQREVGGNLAELLMTVADTMTQRERLRRDVAALTAEGKMSAIVLGLLPPGLMGAMWVMNPEYIAKLFSGTGLMLLGAALVAMLIGFGWMKKTITIEV